MATNITAVKSQVSRQSRADLLGASSSFNGCTIWFTGEQQNYGKKIPIAIICEDLPEKKNFIELDKNIKDSNGIPGIKVNYKLSDNTKKMLAHGLTKGKELMTAAGSKKNIIFGPVKHTGWHLMGNAKMGFKKENSVVNAYGQTHDIKNLFIVDSSIFATASSVNPVSTIISLSLMITDKIKKQKDLLIK